MLSTQQRTQHLTPMFIIHWWFASVCEWAVRATWALPSHVSWECFTGSQISGSARRVRVTAVISTARRPLAVAREYAAGAPTSSCQPQCSREISNRFRLPRRDKKGKVNIVSTGEKAEIDVLFDRWTVMSHVDMVVLERLLCWHGTGESVFYSQSQLFWSFW